jgi:hypothetical protein
VTQVLGGIAKEFEQRYGHDFYKIDRLFDAAVPQEEKDRLCEWLLAVPLINMPIWFRDFVERYKTPEALQGREARVTWHAYVKGVIENWHTLISELQHALDRVRLRTEARGKEWENMWMRGPLHMRFYVYAARVDMIHGKGQCCKQPATVLRSHTR